MDFISIISCASTVIGLVVIYTKLVRNTITKEEFNELMKNVTDVTSRVVELEKKSAVMEYRLSVLETSK